MSYPKNEDIYIKQSEENIILFVHGIFSSHVQFRKLIRIFKDLNYSIYAVSLDGHGDDSRELSKVTHQSWINQIDVLVNDLLSKYTNVYVISHSLGTLLSMNAKNINEVRKLVLLSPAIKPQVTFQSMKLGMFLDKKNLKDPYLIENRKIRGVVLKGWRKVHSIKPILALFKIVRITKKKLKDITADALIAISKKDESVRFKAGKYVYNNISSTNKNLIEMEKSYHAFFDPIEEESLNKEIVDFILSDIQTSI